MRTIEPFQADDLAELDEQLLARASAVVAMEDIDAAVIPRESTVIGLRHDVDNDIRPAVAVAEWEAERGYRASFFILHTAPYWQDKELLQRSLERIAELGHEIGIHANAIAAALLTGRDPVEILAEAIAELRGYGYPVKGVVAHGDQLCYDAGFVNDEIFLDSIRPAYGDPNRELHYNGVTIQLQPVLRSTFELEYDPNWLSRALYLSDSGGRWSEPFDETAAAFPHPKGQLHMLWHPDWWSEAFALEQVTT